MRLIDADNLFNNQILVVSNSASLEVIEKIMDIIKEAPTIEAEPVRHGHWTLDRHEHGVCSVCHMTSVDIIGGEFHNYCPNCGAKMDEVKK